MFLFQIFLPVACYISLAIANVENRTILFGDSSLDFAIGWLASHEQLSGGLFFTFDQTGVVALKGTLPKNTQRFDYIGLKRTGGSLYGVCLNCDEDDSSILPVDGHDDTLEDDNQATPTTIFSLEVERDKQNTFVLFNLADGKFNDQSSITFQSLTVTIDDGIDDNPNSSSSSGIQTTSLGSTSIPPSLPTSQTSATGSTSTPSSSPTVVSIPANNSTRSSVIAIIVVFTVLPIVSLAIGLYFFMRHRARRKSRMSDFFMYNPNPVRRRLPSFRASRSQPI